MLIVGQSGAGKTAMLMRFLLTSALLNYDKLYVFARSLHQAEYQCLMDGFENKLHKLDIQDMLGVGDLIRKKKSWIKEVAVALREHKTMAAGVCVCVQGEDVGKSAAAGEVSTPAKTTNKYVICTLKYNTWEFVFVFS